MADKLYIEKSRYDVLLRAYLCSKRENLSRENAWAELKSTMAGMDDTIRSNADLLSNDSCKRCYVLGALETRMTIQDTMNQLEEKIYVSNRK